MGLFSSIMEKLGFGASPAQAAPAPQAPPTAAPTPVVPAPPKAIKTVDVVAKLEGLATSHKEKLVLPGFPWVD
jgi:hypothetical protein